MHRYRSTSRAEAAIQLRALSWGLRKNSLNPAGSSQPMGRPSTSTPTRPSSSPAENRSGRSVERMVGKAVRTSPVRYSSRLAGEMRPSMSISASRFSTAAAVAGSAMPSIHTTSTGVTVCRPTICSWMRRAGVRTRRRRMEVLVRTDSTKASRGPFRGGSFSEGEMDRFSSVWTRKESALPVLGKKRRHQPLTRSKAPWSAVVRSSTMRL